MKMLQMKMATFHTLRTSHYRVMNIDTFNSCIKWNAKVVEDDQDPDHNKCIMWHIIQYTDTYTIQLSIKAASEDYLYCSHQNSCL